MTSTFNTTTTIEDVLRSTTGAGAGGAEFGAKGGIGVGIDFNLQTQVFAGTIGLGFGCEGGLGALSIVTCSPQSTQSGLRNS